MFTESNFIFSFLSLVVFSALIWLVALIHAATNKNFKDSTTKLMWVLIIVFTNAIGALVYLLFGRPKVEKLEAEPKKASKIGILLSLFWSMPLGIKILSLLSIYGVIDTILNIGRLFASTNFYGIQLSPLLSVIYNLIFFVISIIILVAYFNRSLLGWKLLIGTGLFQLISFVILKVPTTIRAIFSPASEIYNIINLNTTAAEYQNSTSYTATKFATISLNIFMLVFMVLVLLYIYKKKNYFSKV